MAVHIDLDIDIEALPSLPPEAKCTPIKGLYPGVRVDQIISVMPTRTTMTSGLMKWSWGPGYRAEPNGCRIEIGDRITYHPFAGGWANVTEIDTLEIIARIPHG